MVTHSMPRFFLCIRFDSFAWSNRATIDRSGIYLKILAALAFLVLLCSPCKAELFWDLDTAQLPASPQLTLRHEGRDIARIQTAHVRHYIDVRSRLFMVMGGYPKVLISDKPELNAYAYSTNGQKTMVVTLKMVEALGDDVDAIAMLMGHEMAHIAQGHGTQRVVRTTLLDVLASIAGAALDAKLKSKGYASGIGQNIAGFGEQVIGSAFSRDAEREADQLGLKWLIEANYNPQGGVRLFQHLSRENGDGGGFLSSHPSGSERIDNIYSQIAKLTPQPKPSPTVIQTAVATASLKAQPPSAITSTLPANFSGQVGIVLTVKERHGYVILSGITPYQLPVGSSVRIVGANGKTWESRIARAVDGYYSAIIDGDASSISQGDKVEITRPF